MFKYQKHRMIYYYYYYHAAFKVIQIWMTVYQTVTG